jgi:hypothetical protein
MSQARWTLFLVTIPALSPAALASVVDRFTLRIASPQSQARFEIDSSLGTCLLAGGSAGSLAGEVDLVLQPGVPPALSGQFDGGRCSTPPDLVGIVPNTRPGAAPLLVVHVDSLALATRSRTFTCDSNGCFLTQNTCEVTDGSLDVSVMGAEFTSVPIVGVRSDSSRSRGRVWVDESGIHVLYEIDTRLVVRVPERDLDLRIAIRSVVRGDADFPVPTRFRPAGGKNGHVARFSPCEEPALALGHVPGSSLPSDFGWESHLDALDVQDGLPSDAVQPPARWSFQFAYRESPAGEMLLGELRRFALRMVS